MCLTVLARTANGTHLALIHNPPVGMHPADAAVRVHALGVPGAPQPESFAASEQDIQVVMEVVVQSRRCTCSSSDKAIKALEKRQFPVNRCTIKWDLVNILSYQCWRTPSKGLFAAE